MSDRINFFEIGFSVNQQLVSSLKVFLHFLPNNSKPKIRISSFTPQLLISSIYSEKIPAGYHGKNLAQSLGIMSLVLMAFNYTGGFFHPVIATARNYGCRGYFRELTSLDHFIVYWIGAILGAILSHILTTKLTKKIDQNK